MIQMYDTNKSLNSNDRTFIVHKIVQYYLENDLKFNVQICKEIAEDIINIFPTEVIDTYFLQSVKKQPPKGKLWDRYQGRKKYMKKLSFKKRKLENQLDVENNGEIEKCEKSELIRTELKYVRDFEQILHKWKETVSYRINQISPMGICESLNFWPLYKSPQNSIILVSLYIAYLIVTN